MTSDSTITAVVPQTQITLGSKVIASKYRHTIPQVQPSI